MKGEARPPALARRLLSVAAPAADRPYLLGDLDEEFQQRAGRLGAPAARRWYWIQVLGSLPPTLMSKRPHRFGRKGNWSMSLLILDLKNAVRSLRRHPAMSAMILLTLTLGIGANTAVFSLVNAILLRPLPYPESDRLVAVWTRYRGGNRAPIEKFRVSAPEYFDYRDDSQSFSALAAYHTWLGHFSGRGVEPARVTACRSTADLFEVLQPSMHLGRGFNREDDRPGSDPVVVLSYALWRDRYGGVSSLLGENILLNEVPTRVIGVLEPGFQFVEQSADLWIPLRLDPADPDRGNHNWIVTGRLRPDVTVEAARSELAVLMQAWTIEHPAHYRGHELHLRSLHADLVAPFRPALQVLSGAVLFVLVLVCANVVNLLLVRAEERVAEFSLRAALGASGWQVFRHLFAEFSLLGVVAAVLATSLALWAISVFTVFWTRIGGLALDLLDLRVPLFGLGAGIGTALLCAALIGWRLSPKRLSATLSATGRGGASGRSWSRVRSGFVVTQIALSLLLVMGTAVATESLFRLTRVDPGFRAEGVTTGNLWLSTRPYAEPATAAVFVEQMRQELAASAGIDGAALTSRLPMTGFPPRDRFEVHTGEATPARGSGGIVLVTPGFFDIFEITLLRGRTFSASDTSGREPVAVVNNRLAELLWPDSDPVGQQLRMAADQDGAPSDKPWMKVVGVVADFHYRSLREPPGPVLFVAAGQAFESTGRSAHFMHLAVRSAGSAATAEAALRGAVARLDADIPVSGIRPLESYLDDSVATDRALTWLLSIFAGVGMVLALGGICGMLLYSVARRRREIGVRMAMGAERRQILALVLKRGLALAGAGIAAGVLLAVPLAPRLQTALDHPVDALFWLPVTAAALLAASLLVCWLPARRAADVEPARALRSDA